jgi:MtN3 and saliva related transmembrane protein
MNFVTLLGLAAGTCTIASFLPQAVKIIKTKHTKDLSLWMYIVLATGVFLWLIYGVLLNDISIIIANGVTLILSFVILLMIIRYE